MAFLCFSIFPFLIREFYIRVETVFSGAAVYPAKLRAAAVFGAEDLDLVAQKRLADKIYAAAFQAAGIAMRRLPLRRNDPQFYTFQPEMTFRDFFDFFSKPRLTFPTERFILFAKAVAPLV